MSEEQQQQVMSGAAYARYLGAQYGLRMTRQGVHKSHVIPKRSDGKINVVDADAALVAAGKIQLLTTKAPEPSDDGDDSRDLNFYREKAKTERITRRLQELKLAEQEGELLRTRDVEEAMVRAGMSIVQDINILPGMADELMAVARNGDMVALRGLLKAKAKGLRATVADALALIGKQAAFDDSE